MGMIMKVHSAILLFILISPSISATLITFELMRGSQGQLIFLCGLNHGTKNTRPGGNHAYVDKLLEILKEAEQRPDGGFDVLVEVSAPKQFPFLNPPTLSHIYDHSTEFTNTSFKNIEVRTCVAAACALFDAMVPYQIVKHFKGPTRDDLESIQRRKLFSKLYKCEMDTITFDDIHNEADIRMAELKKLSAEWRSLWSEWSLIHPGAADELDFGIGSITIAKTRLLATIATYATSSQEKVMDCFQRLWDAGQKNGDLVETYFQARTRLMGDCVYLGEKIFNTFLFDSLYRVTQIVPSKPIIIIAGAAHCSYLHFHLKKYGFIEVIAKDYYKEQKDFLGIELFDYLKQPLGDWAPKNTLLSYATCMIQSE
jgi:hypothetical protein